MARAQIAKESVLVLGGARSGKSAYTQRRAQEWEGKLVYIATAEGKDEKMKKRIAAHRARRRSRRWETIEEPLEVVWQLKEIEEVGAVMLDCVTLWVANALRQNRREELENQVAELVEEIPLFSFHFLVISNEVGLGLLPETASEREYQDLLGLVNQQLAAACKEVIFMTAGLPLKVKG